MARLRIGVDDAHAKYERDEITIIDQLTTNQDREASQQIVGAIRIPAPSCRTGLQNSVAIAV
jgi:hypothetical protein